MSEGDAMASLLAGIVGNLATWLGAEVFPFLMNSILCLIALGVLAVLIAFLVKTAIGLLSDKPNQAAEDDPPRTQLGEGSPN